MNPTSPENLKKINVFFEAAMDKMSHLSDRWKDEKEYEDINDYKEAIINILPVGFTLTKMNKTPFGFNFNIGTEAEYAYIAKTRSHSWKRIK